MIESVLKIIQGWVFIKGNSDGTFIGNTGDSLKTINSQILKTTYSASILGLNAPTTPTDSFTITGSSTKIVKILKIGVSGTQNTSGIRNIQIIKRSSANTGGTSSTVSATPHDATDAASTATVRAYTANPTSLGTQVGSPIRTFKLDLSATNLVGSSDYRELLFGVNSKPIILNNTSELLAINLNSVTSNNSSWNFFIEWTEE